MEFFKWNILNESYLRRKSKLTWLQSNWDLKNVNENTNKNEKQTQKKLFKVQK